MLHKHLSCPTHLISHVLTACSRACACCLHDCFTELKCALHVRGKHGLQTIYCIASTYARTPHSAASQDRLGRIVHKHTQLILGSASALQRTAVCAVR